MAYTQSDLDAVRQAKLSLARGERVRRVTVNGNTVERSEITMESLRRLEQEILRALRKNRRRAYSLYSTKGV